MEKKIATSPSPLDNIRTRLGLKPGEGTFNPSEYKGDSIHFSSDPIISDVPPRFIVMHNVDEMKALIGNDNSDDDTNVSYPPAYPAGHDERLKGAKSKAEITHNISDEVRGNLKSALYAYISGNAEKVKDYKQVINAVMFPIKIAFFVAATPTIIDSEIKISINKDTKDTHHILKVYTDITFKDGGYFNVLPGFSFSLQCNSMNKVS